MSVAATGTSAGSSGPALLRGRSSGGRLRWLPFDWRLLTPFFLLGSAAGMCVLLWFLIVVAGQGASRVMLLRSCGPVDGYGDRAPLRPLVAPVMGSLAFGASARAGQRSRQTSCASPSASVIPCCCSRPSPFTPEAELSLLSGLSAVPPLGVCGTLPTLFRQEGNRIMANQ